MTHKIFEILPSKNLPWFKTYTNPVFNWSEYVTKIYAQQSAWRQAFGFGFNNCNYALEQIAFSQAQAIDLLRINEDAYMGKAWLVEKATDIKESLDKAWNDINNNDQYRFYYVNRDSGLSKDVYSILNIVLNDI